LKWFKENHDVQQNTEEACRTVDDVYYLRNHDEGLRASLKTQHQFNIIALVQKHYQIFDFAMCNNIPQQPHGRRF